MRLICVPGFCGCVCYVLVLMSFAGACFMFGCFYAQNFSRGGAAVFLWIEFSREEGLWDFGDTLVTLLWHFVFLNLFNFGFVFDSKPFVTVVTVVTLFWISVSCGRFGYGGEAGCETLVTLLWQFCDSLCFWISSYFSYFGNLSRLWQLWQLWHFFEFQFRVGDLGLGMRQGLVWSVVFSTRIRA